MFYSLIIDEKVEKGKNDLRLDDSALFKVHCGEF